MGHIHLFRSLLTAGIFWVWFCLPETKNASLEEMDRVFKSHTGERDALLMREAQEEVGLTGLLETQAKQQEKVMFEHV